jgi:hypothetical protein
MVMMVMRCALYVVVVVYLLAGTCLWETKLSSVDESGTSRKWRVLVWLVVMMVTMMMTNSLAKIMSEGWVHILVVRSMVVMMPRVSMLVPLCAAQARGCSPPISTVNIETVLIFDPLRLPTLLGVHSLQPRHVARL